MRKLLFTLLLLLSLVATSCELVTPEPERSINVVTIGIGYSGKNALYGPPHDARDLMDTFLARYPGQVKAHEALIMETDTGTKVLQKDIEDAITGLPDADLTIVTYSGHGLSDGSLVMGGVVLLPDGDPANKQWKLNWDNIFPADEFFALLESLDHPVLLIIDSCFSGNFVDENTNWVERYFTGHPLSNIQVISSTTKDNTAKEPDIKEPHHGFFTEALLKGLSYYKQPVRLTDLYLYIKTHQRIPTSGKNKDFYQMPKLSYHPQDILI